MSRKAPRVCLRSARPIHCQGGCHHRLAIMAQPRFQYLKCQVQNGILVITITAAEIHSEGMTEDLRLELLAAAGSQENPKVVLDFQPVRLISTTCLRALLSF